MTIKRKIAALIIAAAVLLSGSVLSAPITSADAASATVSKITVTFYGDAKSARGFTWYTGKGSTSSAVQVVEKTGAAPDFGKAATFAGTTAVPRNSSGERVHKAVATGLKSNTAYDDRVGDPVLNVWSSPGSFTTAPESGPFTFIDLSDTQFANQAGSLVTADLITKAAAQAKNPAFLVHNGDVVDSKSETQWNLLLNNSKSVLTNLTILPAAGNHDISNSTFIDHFNLDTGSQKTTTGAYYSVTYGNTAFIVLNTNETSKSYAEFTQTQIDWLKTTVKAAKTGGATWIIVVMHMGPYTTGDHASYSNVIDTRKKLPPIFSELGVDLVLQGHDHVYSRTKPIASGAAAAAALVTEDFEGTPVSYLSSPKGTVYVTPGTAGTKHYYQNARLSQSYLRLFDVAGGPYKGDPDWNNKETFMTFTVDGSKLTATAYQVSKTVNNGAPYVIDRFGIMK